MTRDRNKPNQSWMERAKNELGHEEELTIERAYELGLIRGKKETIEKACVVFCKRCVHNQTLKKCMYLEKDCPLIGAFRKDLEE